MSSVEINPGEAIDLMLKGIPLLDVRAETEFAHGTLPNAVNLPILNDNERQQVGICYKNEGQAAAIKLGNKLISGTTKAKRVAKWQAFIEAHPESALFCWRGGLRSKTAAGWLAEKNTPLPRIEAGYKAVRTQLLQTLSQIPHKSALVILGGKTGTGKTQLLRQIYQHVNLEALAKHRGSAFGGHLTPQPTPINFENNLALRLLGHQNSKSLLLEDEGRTIGRLTIPAVLHDAMQQADIVLLEEPLEQRVHAIFQEYIVSALADYRQAHKEDADEHFCNWLLNSLFRIRKRLGGERYQKLHRSMQCAFKQHPHNLDGHLAWITDLLVHYYDPMYEYQLNKKNARIQFRGNTDAVLGYLTTKLDFQVN